MDDSLYENFDECFKILDENLDILNKIAADLEDEKEDQLVPNMELHQLLDMTEDVSESAKIKLAESNLARRQVDYNL